MVLGTTRESCDQAEEGGVRAVEGPVQGGKPGSALGRRGPVESPRRDVRLEGIRRGVLPCPAEGRATSQGCATLTWTRPAVLGERERGAEPGTASAAPWAGTRRRGREGEVCSPLKRRLTEAGGLSPEH